MLNLTTCKIVCVHVYGCACSLQSPLFMVRIPDGILTRSCETLRFTPIGGRDVMVLKLSTASDETISSLTLSAASDFFSRQASCQIIILPTSYWKFDCVSAVPSEQTTLTVVDHGISLSAIPPNSMIKVHYSHQWQCAQTPIYEIVNILLIGSCAI